MKSPSEFQTSGVVLLAGTMITGFLTVVVLLPMLRQEALRPRIVKAADQVPLSGPLREEAARLNEFAVATTAGEPQHCEDSAARSGMDVSEASHRRTASARTEPNSAATTRDEDRERPHHAGMPVGSPSLIDSEGRRYVPQQVAAATPLSDPPLSDPLSSGPMYRQRVSRQMSSDRGDESAATFPRSEFQPSFYAPVTVHPVTVNIDGGIFGEHLQALNQRLDRVITEQNHQASSLQALSRETVEQAATKAAEKAAAEVIQKTAMAAPTAAAVAPSKEETVQVQNNLLEEQFRKRMAQQQEFEQQRFARMERVLETLTAQMLTMQSDNKSERDRLAAELSATRAALEGARAAMQESSVRNMPTRDGSASAEDTTVRMRVAMNPAPKPVHASAAPTTANPTPNANATPTPTPPSASEVANRQVGPRPTVDQSADQDVFGRLQETRRTAPTEEAKRTLPATQHPASFRHVPEDEHSRRAPKTDVPPAPVPVDELPVPRPVGQTSARPPAHDDQTATDAGRVAVPMLVSDVDIEVVRPKTTQTVASNARTSTRRAASAPDADVSAGQGRTLNSTVNIFTGQDRDNEGNITDEALFWDPLVGGDPVVPKRMPKQEMSHEATRSPVRVDENAALETHGGSIEHVYRYDVSDIEPAVAVPTTETRSVTVITNSSQVAGGNQVAGSGQTVALPRQSTAPAEQRSNHQPSPVVQAAATQPSTIQSHETHSRTSAAAENASAAESNEKRYQRRTAARGSNRHVNMSRSQTNDAESVPFPNFFRSGSQGQEQDVERPGVTHRIRSAFQNFGNRVVE